MLVSVIIKTKDEAERLRLTLTSLSRQTVPIVEPGASAPAGEVAAEVIVVSDGSTDGTPEVLEIARRWLPFRTLELSPGRGRTTASNAGAKSASGEILLFLDGDSVAAPDLIERHARAHEGPAVVNRGENRHLRCTRFFQDPEAGTPRPGCEEQVRRMGADLNSNLVSRRSILEAFGEVDARSQPGIYPGAGPRRLFELEWDALTNHRGLGVLWMAASGQNMSLRRGDFEAVGGFDERLTLNEHRELAFRLNEVGIPVRPVPGAKTYHLTHRVGWRDPLTEPNWERTFHDAHPCLAVRLMSVFWLSLAGDEGIPEEARILSLPQMDAILSKGTDVDYDALRARHPRLGPLT